MAILPIVLDPDPVLRRKAQPVRKINAAVRRLLDDMAETMYDAPGIGLAAPQVGVSKRMIVVDVGDEHGLIAMINPEIISSDGWEEGPEGCLSIPGMVGEVGRPAQIRVVGLDRQGNRFWVEGDGMLARCFQHEIDHLDGILFTDKATDVRPTRTNAADDAATEDVDDDPAGADPGVDAHATAQAAAAPTAGDGKREAPGEG